MEANPPVRAIRLEPRWPPALAILVVLLVLALPGRVRLMPFWVPYVAGAAILLPMAGVWLSKGRARWRRLERMITLVFSIYAEIVTFVTLGYLMFRMVNDPAHFSGRQLLATSIGAWVTNILAFSMFYWMLDRDGPEARANDTGRKPDWLYPQTGVPGDAPAGWRPTYIDYLYLAFTTATAFSTTEVAPLTSRAKLMMMIESAVSLATLVIVASRAINILGS